MPTIEANCRDLALFPPAALDYLNGQDTNWVDLFLGIMDAEAEFDQEPGRTMPAVMQVQRFRGQGLRKDGLAVFGISARVALVFAGRSGCNDYVYNTTFITLERTPAGPKAVAFMAAQHEQRWTTGHPDAPNDPDWLVFGFPANISYGLKFAAPPRDD